MPAPIVMGAMKLASFFGPMIGQAIFGDDGEKVAKEVVEVAQAVTGKGTAEGALEVLKADPQIALQFQQGVMNLEIRLSEEETKRQAAVNATMQTEITSYSEYVRNWRPTFGYLVAATWFVQMAAASAAMVIAVWNYPTEAASVMQGIGAFFAATTIMWTIALSVLGVSVTARSGDKKVAAGVKAAPGLFDLVKEKVFSKSKLMQSQNEEKTKVEG